jgi:hypothetical protein
MVPTLSPEDLVAARQVFQAFNSQEDELVRDGFRYVSRNQMTTLLCLFFEILGAFESVARSAGNRFMFLIPILATRHDCFGRCVPLRTLKYSF